MGHILHWTNLHTMHMLSTCSATVSVTGLYMHTKFNGKNPLHLIVNTLVLSSYERFITNQSTWEPKDSPKQVALTAFLLTCFYPWFFCTTFPGLKDSLNDTLKNNRKNIWSHNAQLSQHDAPHILIPFGCHSVAVDHLLCFYPWPTNLRSQQITLNQHHC